MCAIIVREGRNLFSVAMMGPWSLSMDSVLGKLKMQLLVGSRICLHYLVRLHRQNKPMCVPCEMKGWHICHESFDPLIKYARGS